MRGNIEEWEANNARLITPLEVEEKEGDKSRMMAERALRLSSLPITCSLHDFGGMTECAEGGRAWMLCVCPHNHTYINLHIVHRNILEI